MKECRAGGTSSHTARRTPNLKIWEDSLISTAMIEFCVRDVIALYLRHSRATGLHCPQALYERECLFKAFLAAHGDLPMDDCKAFHLSDWIESHEAWKSVSTRRAKANMIRAAFQWALDGERIHRNPFKRVRYAEAERRPDLADDCLCKLEGLANKQYESVLRFLRLTGCRIGELCAATWSEVDLNLGIWTIQKHKSRRYTKKAKVVALIPEAVNLLIGLAKLIPISPLGKEVAGHLYIFTNTRGTPWTRRTLGQQLRRMKLKHDITEKATLHGVRHRFASASIAAGAPIKLVAQQLGHSTIAVTERFYCDLSNEIESIKAAAQLGQPEA